MSRKYDVQMCKLTLIIIFYLYMLVRIFKQSAHTSIWVSGHMIWSIRTYGYPSIRAKWLLNGDITLTHFMQDMTSSGPGPKRNTVYCKFCILLTCMNIIKTLCTLFNSKTSQYTLGNMWYTWFDINIQFGNCER